MLRKLFLLGAFLCASLVSAGENPRLAIVPGGDPLPGELLVLSEAKLFDLPGIVLVERSEIDKVLAEQKLGGLFDVARAVQLGKILRAELFAVLETTSIIVFDAETGLRYVDESLSDEANDPKAMEKTVENVVGAVKAAVEKREKLEKNKLVTFGVLEVRNADFPAGRDIWCKAMAGLLERELLKSGAAVLERSRLSLVNRERQLTADGSNKLLASMQLIDLEFTRGEQPQSFRITARIGEKTFREEGMLERPMEAIRKLGVQVIGETEGGNEE